MEKRSAPLRHSGLIPYFNTFRVVLKCILATLGSISSPCRATSWRAAFTTWPEAPSGNFIPAPSPAASIQFTKRSRARMDAAATATSLSARTRCQDKRIGELVAQRHGAIRHLGRQTLNHRSMPPGQKTVQIPELRIKLVIPFRTNAYQVKPDARHPADPLRQETDSG